MYFHPLILTEAQKQQRAAACQDFARLRLDGIDRQYRLHMKALSEFGIRQQENLRALSEALDITHFLVRWSASAAPAPLDTSARRDLNDQGKSRRRRVMA